MPSPREKPCAEDLHSREVERWKNDHKAVVGSVLLRRTDVRTKLIFKYFKISKSMIVIRLGKGISNAFKFKQYVFKT
jgi:hypothetical protein